MLISAYEICLERVAEELMGRRKWKQYQDAVSRNHLSTDTKTLDQIDISIQKLEPMQKLEKLKINQNQHPLKSDSAKIKTEELEVLEKIIVSRHIKQENDCLKTEENLQSNNNNTASQNIHNNNKHNEELQPSSSETPPPPTPIDWKPNEKCDFCVDGKLLTVNEKGELVAESSPALSEADLANRPPTISDSDSSESLVPDARVDAKTVIPSRLKDSVPPNMTSLESMAAQWTTIQTLPGLQSGLGQLYPSILYNLTQHMNSATPTTSETSVAAVSPSPKDSPSPSDLTGEQPLDLSSKPSPNPSIGGDVRHTHRAKPRATACSGRRTYTEEELNSALQDIMSGRLGTRRAAVQYNIPRSTLRNKVYKISSGVKRESSASLHHLASLEDLADADDDKQDLSADEDSNGEKNLSSSLAIPFTDSNITSNLQNIRSGHATHSPERHSHQTSDIQFQKKPTASPESFKKRKETISSPHTSPVAQNSWSNVLLQSLLFSGGLPMQQNFEEALQLFNALLMKQDPNFITPQLLLQVQRLQQSSQLAQQEQQPKNLHSTVSPSAAAAAAVVAAAASFQGCQPKAETPEMASSIDMNEALGDDPSVILKIPSYKPVAGSSTSSTPSATVAAPTLSNNNNSDDLPPDSSKTQTVSSLFETNPSTQAPYHLHRIPHNNPSVSSSNKIPGLSPPLIRQNSEESESPPTLSLRDVIANSISRTFSQQANKDAISPSPAHSASSPMDHNDQYKRPSISVIRNIGGTDTSRFATAPNLLGGHTNPNHHQQHHHHQHHSQNVANNSLAGGKGTRPKRGKYRNYDRDSLVEAVKAVQRGEMSVHRAGSYYGVPHSTLEYKVKERHLMRPRKREPKPQPVPDERTSAANTSNLTASSSKNSNIPGLSTVNSLDKLNKSGAVKASLNQKQSNAGSSQFSSTSPNGIKMQPALFDTTLAAQLQYPPHLFWHGGFGPLQMDFNSRSQSAAAVAAASASSGGAGNPSFAANAELFKSQMIQRYHEERRPSNAISSLPVSTKMCNSNSSNTNNKSAREIADNLYEPVGGSNGSFLDGIIRKTLDRKSSDITQGALLDQLVKNSKPPLSRIMINNERSDEDSQQPKRPGSPMQYGNYSLDIKRERASPTSDSSNSDLEHNHRRDLNLESVSIPSQYHTIGLHHGLLSGNNSINGVQNAPASQLSRPDSNQLGSSSSAVTISILQETLGQIKSETEDSL